MPWFKLDDSFHSHPKVIAAGNEAVGLYVRCGTYAAQHLTDGFIRQDVALLYGSAELADTLVRVTLWHRARGGWLIHDYLDYNPSAEQVKQDRKHAAERQRRHRSRPNRDIGLDLYLTGENEPESRKETVKQRKDATSEGITSRRDSRVTNTVSHTVSHTTPTRPDLNTPQPPASGGHDGSHQNCRACGTSPRGPSPPPVPTPMPPAYQRPNGRGRVASEDVAGMLNQARQAMRKEEP